MEDLERIAEPIAASHGCRIVDLVLRREGRSRIVRLFIERVDADPRRGAGVSVELCATVSRDLAVALDAADIVSGSYTLEVSSAGLDRPIKKLADYDRFLGLTARLKLKAPREGRRVFTGSIQGRTAEAVLLRVEGAGEVAVPFATIQQANLVPEIETDLRARTGDERRCSK